MYFGSDNQTGASAQVFKYLQQANEGICTAYGDDEWTGRAVTKIQELFECDAEVFLVSTGTAANSMALACMTEPWDSIVCHGQAHIFNDELTAPEFFTGGARLVALYPATQRVHFPSQARQVLHGDSALYLQPIWLTWRWRVLQDPASDHPLTTQQTGRQAIYP